MLQFLLADAVVEILSLCVGVYFLAAEFEPPGGLLARLVGISATLHIGNCSQLQNCGLVFVLKGCKSMVQLLLVVYAGVGGSSSQAQRFLMLLGIL